jgi:hypothetical protein
VIQGRIYKVTSIVKETNNTVTFYDRTTVVGSFSQLKKMPERDRDGGLNIILTDMDKRQFWFNVWDVSNVDGTSYSTLTRVGEGTYAAYQTRINAIYEQLVTQVFKDCCCGDSPTSLSFGNIQYEYSDYLAGDGQFVYDEVSDPQITISLTSYLNQVFTDVFHHFPDGAWLKFYDTETRSQIAVLEVSNYVDNGDGTVTWDVNPIEVGTFDANTIYNLEYDLTGGSGGLQDFQGVLDTGSLLDKDNTVDGGGFDFDWTNFAEYDIGVSSFFRALAGAGGYFSRVYVDPTTGSFDVSGTGTQSAKVSASNSGGVPNVTLRATDGVTETTEIILLEDGMFMVTPDVNSGTAVNGMSILLSDNTNGRIEFGTPSGIGTTATAPSDVADSSANVLKDLTGCSVPIVAGNTYYFMAFGSYDANSTAIGSRWTVNGPAATYLAYSSNYSLSATSATNNQGLSAYQLPSSNNSTSAATSGNTFKIEGIIIPSANGSLQVQFACESALGTITAKAGSFLKVIQL